MSRSTKIVSRDGLDKFISSFKKFDTSEDLTDTDSESDSEDNGAHRNAAGTNRPVNGSSDKDDSTLRSVFAMCIPRLESALYENVSQIQHPELVETVLEWICKLDRGHVLQAVRSFSSALDDLTNPHNPDTISLRQYLTHLSTANTTTNSTTDIQVTPNSALSSLLLQSTTEFSPPPLVHFLLLLLHHTANTSLAAEVVQRLLSTLRCLTSLDRPNNTSDTQVILVHIMHLQYVLKLMESHAHSTTHSTTTADTTSTTDTNSISTNNTHNQLNFQLCAFSKQHTALMPIIGCAVRSALLYCAMAPPDTNYGLLEGLLSHSPTETQLKGVYSALSTIHTTSTILNTNNTTASSVDITNANPTSSGVTSSTSNSGSVPVVDTVVVKEDSGYDYLQFLSREETIKALYPLPAGSFLLRPHDSASQQYFLSFRTASGTTTNNSSNSAGTSGLTRVVSGKVSPEATVKHAVIRRTLTTTINTMDSANTTISTVAITTVPPMSPLRVDINSTSTGSGAGGSSGGTGDDGNVSPLPVLLRQPHVYGGSASSGNLHGMNTTNGSASSGTANTGGMVRYQYQCGKIGPCDSMVEMLSQISSVLETPLIFTPIPATESSSGSSGSSANAMAGVKTIPFTNTVTTPHATNTTASHSILDINYSLWAHLSRTLSTSTTNIATTATATTPYTSLHTLNNINVLTHAVLEQPWQVSAQPEVMSHVFDQLLRVLGVGRCAAQLAGALSLCEAQVALDIANSNGDSSSGGSSSSSSSSGGGGSVSCVESMYQQLADPTYSTSTSASISTAVVFHSWLAPYHHYLATSEHSLQGLLLPAPPLHSWYTPPRECNVPRERAQLNTNSAILYTATNLSTTTTPLPTITNTTSNTPAGTAFAPADELLVAEHLLAHVSASVGEKSIRLNNAAGTEHITLAHCLVAEEVHRVVAQWWEACVLHEGAVARKVSARRMADRVRSSAASSGTSGGASTGAGSAAGTITDGTTASKLTLSQFDQDFNLPTNTTSDYETAIVSTLTHTSTSTTTSATSNTTANTTTTPTTLSLALYTILKRVHAILSMDLTTSSKEYTRRIVAWLSDELQIVYEIVRPGEYAFSAAQRYYCPHHPYEVKVLKDFTQASERVRLGRHVYYTTPSTPSGSSVNSVSSSGVGSGGGAESAHAPRSEYFVRTVEAALRAAASNSISSTVSTTTSPTTYLTSASTSNSASYSASVVATGISALDDSLVQAPPLPPLPLVDEVLEGRVASCARLWNLLGAEQYLSHTLTSAPSSHLRELLPVHYPAPTPDSNSSTSGSVSASSGGSGSISTPKESNSEHNTYIASLERCLYHNNLHARMCFAARSVPIVQVDVYALQEILAVRTVSSALHAPVAIPSGVSPLTYMSLFNKPTLLTPTANAHSAGALDIYTVMRLSHTTSSTSTSTHTHGSGTGKSNTHTPLSSKNCPIGSVVSSVHKAEARRTPFEHTTNHNTTSATNTNAPSGTSTSTTIAPNWSRAQQQAVARAVEYNFREQALFRFALPEGLVSLHMPPHAGTVTLLPYPEYSTSSTSSTSSSTANTTNTTSNANATTTNSTSTTSVPLSPLRVPKPAATLPPTVLHIPQHYYEVPSVLVVAVYERTFFSDTLLGELELDLSVIHEKRIIRGWYPLTLDRSISWMVYLQVRLKMQELCIETLHTSNGSGGVGGDSSGSSTSGGGLGARGASSVGLSDVGDITAGPNTPIKGGGGNVHGMKIFKQMDDF